MQRIFIELAQQKNNRILIDPNTHHHLFTVCRLTANDSIEIVINGTLLLTTTILNITSNGFTYRTISEKPLAPNRFIAIRLLQSLPKQDKLTEVCRLAASVGVGHIHPVISEWCVAKEISNQKNKRLHAAIDSTMKQSKQVTRPIIHDLVPLHQCLSAFGGNNTLKLVAYEQAEIQASELIIPADVNEIILAIGPEGGFSSTDIQQFKAADFQVFSLGPHIFRTEHAGFAAINYLDGFFASRAPK